MPGGRAVSKLHRNYAPNTAACSSQSEAIALVSRIQVRITKAASWPELLLSGWPVFGSIYRVAEQVRRVEPDLDVRFLVTSF